ncbi:putative pentatricopeptide repeat-containing protein At3g23330 [Tasmannia lanceolata]|uniref:putative pentatricopeptide repeat-containing protein At3g23330 n=1 Tax=Tasmannia lanceolata TaxID=3420 RepID=UPI0040635BB2
MDAASALVDVHAKMWSPREAEFVLEITIDSDVIMWKSVIVGYALIGDIDSAFKILQRYHKSKFRPDSTTYPYTVYSLEPKTGKEIHSYTFRNGLGSRVDEDIVTYNTTIAAVGMHGHPIQAFSIFSHMEKEIIKPDKPLSHSLSACSHASIVDSGWLFYNFMIDEYGILSEMEHYSCMETEEQQVVFLFTTICVPNQSPGHGP